MLHRIQYRVKDKAGSRLPDKSHLIRLATGYIAGYCTRRLRSMKPTICALGCALIVFAGYSFQAFANPTTESELGEDIFDMSLSELMNIDVSTGAMQTISARKTQHAITVISRREIQFSPARNIAALLEAYVPGLLVMTHSEGDKLGLRGMIAAENYKLILLLNGRNISNFVYEGVITEIDMWDLDDIERIEVIRGPGSVTYGTGAIAGVINIITRKPESYYTRVSASSDVVYNSYGGNLTISQPLSDTWDVLAFGSFRSTKGQQDAEYRFMSGDTSTTQRLMGFDDPNSEAQDYLADGLDRPQVKGLLQFTNNDNFDIVARYTQSGQTHHTRSKFNVTNEDGEVTERLNDRQVALRSFGVFPTLKVDVIDNIQSSLKLGFDSQEYIRIDLNANGTEMDRIENYRDYAFSQDRYDARLESSYSNDDLNVSVGIEFNHIQVGAPWFSDADELLIREGVYILSDTNTSVYWNNPEATVGESNGAFEVGDGFGVSTFSLMAQGDMQLFESTTLFAGFRLDKPSISSVQFSPRLSVLHDIDENNSLRLTWQTSQRLMPLRAQYLYYQRDRTSDDKLRHEEIMATELSWKTILSEHVSIETHAFYNDIDIVGFTGRDLQFIGNQQDAGLELETVYKQGGLHVRLSHAAHFPLDFTANQDLADSTNRNNITFSEYVYQPNTGYPILLKSTGSDLNNWSNHTTKVVARQSLLDGKLQLHVDARVFWGFQGSLDEIEMYRNAYNAVDKSQLSPEELAVHNSDIASFEHEVALIEETGAYETTFTLNAALSYSLQLSDTQSLTFTLFGERLLGDSFRYYVSTGSSRAYPERLRWIQEPTTIGLKAQLLIK